jgi:hypothetical protein
MTTILKQATPAHVERRAPLGSFVVTAVALSAFGPYLVGSIRTEQVAVYGLAALVLPFTLSNIRGGGAMRFIVPWTVYLVTATLSVLLPSRMISPREPGNLLGGYDNIILPAVVLTLVLATIPAAEAGQMFARVCKIVAVAMSVNGFLAVIATRTDLSLVLRPFWGSATAEGTTAELAAQLGRYGGIFNQPAEAGVLYGIAGIAAIYAWKTRPALLAMLLTLICLGGLISVSKIFILGGLPFVAFYWMWSQRRGRKVGLLFGIGLLGLGVLQSGLFQQWTGFNYLARLINPQGDGGALAFYTAGRLAQDSAFTNLVDAALKYSPIVGVGPGGWKTAYDGAIPETLVVAGVVGLLGYATVLLAIFTLKGGSRDLRMFTILFGIIVAGACMGFSPLTANRDSAIIWLMIGLLALATKHARSTPSDGLIRHAACAPQP